MWRCRCKKDPESRPRGNIDNWPKPRMMCCVARVRSRICRQPPVDQRIVALHCISRCRGNLSHDRETSQPTLALACKGCSIWVSFRRHFFIASMWLARKPWRERPRYIDHIVTSNGVICDNRYPIFRLLMSDFSHFNFGAREFFLTRNARGHHIEPMIAESASSLWTFLFFLSIMRWQG